jgi:hypothetical protein
MQPSNAAGLMYDTLYVMRACIMSQGLTGGSLQPERVKLRDCLANMKNQDAPLTGATSMDKEGDAVRKPVILEAKGDKFVVAQ